MNKFFCVYSGNLWPESERSAEHIIPYSIGGSNQFVIHDVAKKINNEVGSKADASLVDNFGFDAERNRLQLKSEKGNIPNIDLSGEMDINGQRVKIRNIVDKSGKNAGKLIPNVRIDWDKGVISGICDPGDYDKIIKDIERKATAKGKKVSFSPKPKSDRIDKPTIEGKVKLNIHSYKKGFIKIALGTGHYTLGYNWSRGEYASRMRGALADNPPVDFERHQLHGYSFPCHDARMAEIMKIDNDHHIVAVINMEKSLACYILLFGQYDALIVMQESYWKNDPNSIIGKGSVYTINAQSRTLKYYSYEEYLRDQYKRKKIR